jgi:hypothetical protein
MGRTAAEPVPSAQVDERQCTVVMESGGRDSHITVCQRVINLIMSDERKEHVHSSCVQYVKHDVF